MKIFIAKIIYQGKILSGSIIIWERSGGKSIANDLVNPDFSLI